jgi:hypothetical protein
MSSAFIAHAISLAESEGLDTQKIRFAVADARELRWVKLMSEQDREYLALVLDVYTYDFYSPDLLSDSVVV